jgi:hypothetical protein
MRGRERGGERGERRVREERTVRNVDGGGKMKIWSEEEEWRREDIRGRRKGDEL